jgi:hypothetical protein
MTSGPTSPPAFDPRAEVDSFATTWRRVVTEPRPFFADMPEVGGLRDPFVFLTVCALLNGAGMMLIRASLTAGIGATLWMLLYVVALGALCTLVAQQLFDGPAGFEPTFRAVAYAAAPLALLWVPGLGLVAQVYGWYLAIRGIEHVHRFDTPRAVLAVAISVVVLAYAGLGHALRCCAAR